MLRPLPETMIDFQINKGQIAVSAVLKVLQDT